MESLLAQASSLIICPSSSFLANQRSQGNLKVSSMASSFTSMYSRCQPGAGPVYSKSNKVPYGFILSIGKCFLKQWCVFFSFTFLQSYDITPLWIIAIKYDTYNISNWLRNSCVHLEVIVWQFVIAVCYAVLTLSAPFLLTFVVMPHSYLGQFAQTEHVRESERIFHFTFKLVPVGALLQRQRASVPVLPKHHHKHIGIGAGT